MWLLKNFKITFVITILFWGGTSGVKNMLLFLAKNFLKYAMLPLISDETYMFKHRTYSDRSDRKHENCVLSILMIIFQLTAVCLYKQETAFVHNTKY